MSKEKKNSKPKINIEDLELVNKISSWFENRLDATDGITEIFSQLGFCFDDNIILYDYDKNTGSFNYAQVSESGKLGTPYKIYLRCGDNENFPEMSFFDSEGEKRYRCTINKSGGLNLNLMFSNIKLYNAVCKFFRSEFNYSVNIEREEYIISMQIRKSDNIDDLTFKLKGGAKIKKYLMRSILPFDIEKLYWNINKLADDTIKNYGGFSLTIRKKKENDGMEITDAILLEHGQLNLFKITQNEITIRIDECSWLYQAPNLTLAFDSEGYHVLRKNENLKVIGLRNEKAKAEEAVDEVKRGTIRRLFYNN